MHPKGFESKDRDGSGLPRVPTQVRSRAVFDYPSCPEGDREEAALHIRD